LLKKIPIENFVVPSRKVPSNPTDRTNISANLQEKSGYQILQPHPGNDAGTDRLYDLSAPPPAKGNDAINNPIRARAKGLFAIGANRTCIQLSARVCTFKDKRISHQISSNIPIHPTATNTMKLLKALKEFQKFLRKR